VRSLFFFAAAALCAQTTITAPRVGVLDYYGLHKVSPERIQRVLATREGDPVLVRKGNVMAATFHPELSDDTRVHAEFLKLVENSH